jgi:phosphomannomutase
VKIVAQSTEILDDSIVHHGHRPGPVRMRVLRRRGAVGGPAGVPDAGLAGQGPVLAPLYDRLRRRFGDATPDHRDGLRLAWADRWLHVRPSGTEPIVRLIAEAPSLEEAEALVAAAREHLH